LSRQKKVKEVKEVNEVKDWGAQKLFTVSHEPGGEKRKMARVKGGSRLRLGGGVGGGRNGIQKRGAGRLGKAH
jgi:hypothetical protein